MPSTLIRKSWSDLSRRPARAVLTALTIALAVASFGILALPCLMDRAMTSEVAEAQLYDLSVPVFDVVLSPAQMSQLARLPNVTFVTARSTFDTTAAIGTRRVATELWGVPDFAHQPLDRVITASRPGPGQVLVDVLDAQLGIFGGKAGAFLHLQSADGSWRTLRVAGSARGMAFNQDTSDNRLVLYATQATVDQLGGIRGANYLEFRLRDTSSSAAHATAAAVRGFLAHQPDRTTFADLPTIRARGDWPGKQAFHQQSEVLDILIVLAVLSAAFLLANTMRTMIAEQTGEIGVMRAIGASRRNIRRTYLRTAALLGLLGAVAGVPLGIGLSYVLVGLFARLLFGVSPSFGIDWPVAIAGGVVGIAGSLLVAWPSLRQALRTPVREALAGKDFAAGFGGSHFDRAVLRSSALPSAVRIGARNIARQTERTTTTIVQVALAVSTFLGLASLGLAVSQTTTQSWKVLNYDIGLSGRLYDAAIVKTVRAEPGVAAVEAINESQMSYHGQTLYALGLPARSFIYDNLSAGRWLTAQDERSVVPVMVAGSAFARVEHLHLGSRVTVNAAAGTATFSVVGIGTSMANDGFNIYTTLGALQAADGHPGATNTLIVRATDKSHSAIDTLTVRLINTMAKAGYPSTAQVIYSDRANNIAQNQTMVLIVQCIGLLIVAISMLGLVNAITMSIIERTREIGVLRCLGARGRDLRHIFRTETLALALAGFVLAVPVGWLLAHALRWLVLHLANLQLPAPYTLGNLVIALTGTLILAVLVIVAPLRRATRLRPGDAIRYT